MESKSIRSIIILLLICSSIRVNAQSQSQLVRYGNDGKLEYTSYTDKGDIIPDFSHCGYMGGGVEIPDVKIVGVINAPSGKDDTAFIQSMIDSVARLKPMSNGFRGTILLKKGTYRISSPLRIMASGIILRGEGDSKEGTILLATSPQRYSLIAVGVEAAPHILKKTTRQITDEYVPSGSKVIHVKNASKIYKVGDNVIVHRPSTSSWIHAIGMDSIPPRPSQGENTYESFERFRKSGKQTKMNGTKQWEVGSKDLRFERKIASVDGDKITLDVPVVNALQKEFGGATIYKYNFPERISHCGIENMYGMSLYDESVKAVEKSTGEYCSDEKHANVFVYFNAVENAWVRKVAVEHFDCCVWTTLYAKYITGEDLSAIKPISVITGGRRYAYSVWGQMNLFQRCYSSHHRHEFVLGASVAGPNAFVDGRGDMSFASSEPHQRWAAGCLFDNITITGPDGSLLAVDRGWFGSGHGWAGAQMVFWNCSAPVIMVMQPPTAQNFAIGTYGGIDDEWNQNARERTIRSINNVSRSHFKYEGSPIVGDGWIELNNQTTTPLSLYYQQLKDRMGVDALKKTMSKEQFDRFISR